MNPNHKHEIPLHKRIEAALLMINRPTNGLTVSQISDQTGISKVIYICWKKSIAETQQWQMKRDQAGLRRWILLWKGESTEQ